MTPADKFAMNRYAASVISLISSTFTESPYVPRDPRGQAEAQVWFWETMAKAVEERRQRAEAALRVAQ